MISFAVSDTLRKGKTLLKSEVAKHLNLKAGAIARDIRSFKSGSLGGRLIVMSKSAKSLTAFKGARQTKVGVTVQVRKREPREMHKRAFIARGKGGIRQVFRRTADPNNPGRLVPRTPIERLGGPTPYGIIKEKPGVMSKVQKELGDVYLVALTQKVDSVLRQTRS